MCTTFTCKLLTPVFIWELFYYCSVFSLLYYTHCYGTLSNTYSAMSICYLMLIVTEESLCMCMLCTLTGTIEMIHMKCFLRYIITPPPPTHTQMARHAWQGYVDYAWGDNELKPLSKRGHSASIFGKNTRLGATIVDSLDTLYIMGLTDQFNQAKEWVKNSLNLDQV